MTPEYGNGNQKDESNWPSCPYTGQDCIFQNLSQLLGANILGSLLSFILTTGEGTRLTLQRNKEGFTLQVTGPLQKTANEAPSRSNISPQALKITTSSEGGRNGRYLSGLRN